MPHCHVRGGGVFAAVTIAIQWQTLVLAITGDPQAASAILPLCSHLSGPARQPITRFFCQRGMIHSCHWSGAEAALGGCWWAPEELNLTTPAPLFHSPRGYSPLEGKEPDGARGRIRTPNIPLLRRATLPIGLRAHVLRRRERRRRSCWYPHPDSNRDWADFKSASSTRWPMRATESMVVPPAGFEPATSGPSDQRLYRLAYRGMFGGQGESRTPKAVFRLTRFSRPAPSPIGLPARKYSGGGEGIRTPTAQ